MALRVTRQNVEVLIEAGIIVSDPFTFSETIAYTTNAPFQTDTVTISDTAVPQIIRNIAVSNTILFTETIVTGGTRSLFLTDELTDDSYGWDPETGEGTIISSGLGDSISYDLVVAPGEIDTVSFNESIGLIHIRALSPDYEIIDAFIISDQADSMTTGEVDTLTITDLAEVEVSKPIFETLTFTETIAVEWMRIPVVTDAFNINQSVTYELIKTNTYCTYSPFVGSSSDLNAPTPPSVAEPVLVIYSDIQFSYPVVSSTTTLTLRGPELGNRERLDFQRIKRETRGGTLIVFADPIWPKNQMMIIDFVGLSETEAQDALTFISTSLGKRIKIRDWEGREWYGFIKTPDNPIIRNQYCNIALALEIEVNLVRTNPEVEDTLTITDSAVRTQVYNRSVTDTLTVTDSAVLVKDRYWISAGASTWNSTANWSETSGGVSGASVPDQHTDARFDANGAGNCTLDMNINVRSIMNSGYIGKFDAATYDVNIENLFFRTTGELFLGSGTWTFTGYYDIGSLPTLDVGTSHVIMTGNDSYIYVWTSINYFYDLTIDAPTALLGANSGLRYFHTLQINDTFDCTGFVIATFGSNLTKLRISANGNLIVYIITVYYPLTEGGITQFDGEFTADQLYIVGPIATNIWVAGDYSNVRLVMIQSRDNSTAYVWRLNNSDYVFDNLQLQGYGTVAGSSLTMDSSTNGPPSIIINGDFTVYNAGAAVLTDTIIDNSGQIVDWTFKGAVITDDNELGTFTWTKGNGKISLEQTSDSNVDFNNWDIEDLEVDNSQTVTFTNGWTTDSFLHKTGTVDWSANSFETVGDFRIRAEANVTGSSLNGCTITVGAVFFVTGEIYDLLDLHAGATWNLVLSSTGNADYVDVDWSNASAAINGYHSDDGGNNTNWSFP